tara:strand:- start:1815 stop:2876 length:1062 start_codon:yes stop_codon:yes gene_type:complete
MNNVQDTNSEPRSLDIDEAAEAILGRWDDGESLSEPDDKDLPSEDLSETEVDEDELDDEDVDEDSDEDLEDPDGDETEDNDEDDDEAEEDDDDEDKEPLTASDDQVVDIAVNGETKKVSVKDLKRLYGQESSLTKKSQELATQRKVAQDELTRTQLSYQKLLERAEERYKPYTDIDMLVASRQMDPETFAQFRQDARQAEDDLKFLKEESGSLMSNMQQQNQASVQAAAQECITVLKDSLPDWGDELYSNIRQYAVQSGLPQEQVDQYTDPSVIMLLNKARLYDQSKLSAKTKKEAAKVTKSKGRKTKVLSSKKSPPSEKSKLSQRKQNAMSGLSSAKDLDDIAEALMSRWET